MGYYASSATHSCELCNAACVTCDGGLATDCLICANNKYLNVNGGG